jgi:hypothetical protein
VDFAGVAGGDGDGFGAAGGGDHLVAVAGQDPPSTAAALC